MTNASTSRRRPADSADRHQRPTIPGRSASLAFRYGEQLIPAALSVDAEAIHDLRALLRRVRVLCRELSHVRAAGPHPLAELRAGATALFRAFGGLRDLHVLESELEELVAEGRLAGRLAPEMVEWIALERKRLRSGVPEAAGFFLQELARFRGGFTPRDALGLAPPERERRLGKRARRLLQALDEARHEGSVQALHKARIRGKELRYALESAGRLPAPSVDGRSEDGRAPGGESLESGLKKLQDALGAVQDAAMVAARVTSLAETGVLGRP